MNQQVRFIRKNGRIIPIRTSGVHTSGGQTSAPVKSKNQAIETAHRPQTLGESLRTQAKIGFAQGGLYTGAMVLQSIAGQHRGALTLAKGAAVAHQALGIYGLGRSVYQAGQSHKRGESAIGSFLMHRGAEIGGGMAGGFVGRAAFNPLVKASMKAGNIAGGAAQAFHGFVKPHTSAYAEYRRFKAAKPVKAGRVIAGLLL